MKKTFLKNIVLLLAAGAMTMGMATTSFAGKSEDGTPGTWKQNENGWWWEQENGWWPSNGWWWLDGDDDGFAERYYFDGYGYLVTNSVTPGGYTVDADGKWVLEGTVPTRYVAGSGVAVASACEKDPEEIIAYLQKFNGGGYIKMVPEDGKVKVGDSSRFCKHGWLWYVYENNLIRFACALALDENGYLMTNAATPDGYQTDAYGRLVVNGTVVTHEKDCSLLANSPVYVKTGKLITEKNGGWDPSLINVSQNTWHAENLMNGVVVPFGELIYLHVESVGWDACGYGYSSCVQELKDAYPGRFESDY